MLLAVHQGTFDAVCHNCGVGSKDVDIKKLTVVDLSKTTSAVLFHLEWVCPFCTAGESWPAAHSPLIDALAAQLGLPQP